MAPLYDLVRTVLYGPPLTVRLAMSIDGARMLAEVDARAWKALAKAAGYRPEFVETTVRDTLRDVARESSDLVARPEHSNDTARQITERIKRLATTTDA